MNKYKEYFNYMNEMITEGPILKNTGWICPNCGCSVNPNLSVCPNCKGSAYVTVDLNAPNVTTTLDKNNLGKDKEQIIFS